jgi:hypothetical protein
MLRISDEEDRQARFARVPFWQSLEGDRFDDRL